MQNHSRSEETVQQRHLPLARFLHGALNFNLRFDIKMIAYSLVLCYVGKQNSKNLTIKTDFLGSVCRNMLTYIHAYTHAHTLKLFYLCTQK